MEGMQPNIDRLKREGLATPTIPASLESDEDMTYLAAEIGRMTKEHPEYLPDLEAALEAAEKYLELDTEGLTQEQIMKAIGTPALGSAIGLLILTVIFPLSPVVAGGAFAGATASIATSTIQSMKGQKKQMQTRLTALRKVIPAVDLSIRK